MTDIIIQGIGGRMGHALCEMIANRSDCRVVAGIDQQDGEQNGIPVYDSVAINRFLDRISGGKLYPADHEAARRADVLEALGDGLADCLLAIQYEYRTRPADKVYQGWIDKQWTKAVRTLSMLEAAPPALGETLTAGDFALAATLGYLALRFKDQWEESHPNLIGWMKAFEARFPAYNELRPAA